MGLGKKRGFRPALLSTPDARNILRAGEVCGVRKEVAGGITRGSDGEQGALLWTLSDASKDRYGDVVSVDGWNTAAYARNPVLLWAHDTEAPPVGRIPDVFTEMKGDSGRLMGRMGEGDWVPRDVQPFAWAVGQMVQLGFLNAVSVGFLPEEFTFNDDWTMNFKAQELLEVSIVPVPANANALAEARSKGLWLPEIDTWLEKTIDCHKPGPSFEIAKTLWSITKRKAVAVHGEEETDDAGAELPEIRELTEAVRENTAAHLELLEELRAERAERKSAGELLERQQNLKRAGRKAADLVSLALKK